MSQVRWYESTDSFEKDINKMRDNGFHLKSWQAIEYGSGYKIFAVFSAR